MAGGWSRDGAVQDQIDDTVADAVLAARGRLAAAASGEGETHCVLCGEEIPEGRRLALPGARTCVACQSGRDARTPGAGINRRGSKDSQLR
ncbi:MAG: DksA/TraR family C4-type zinc finger protein [Allosphingosinicella sp.]|uniref:DksA/TraR family C4-type zinc finger protein n=1 Tax=Allosphingosinicella sp. TaxID=2823234 RepID=UPI0039240CE9